MTDAKTPKQVAIDAATFLLHSYSMGDREQRPWVAQAIVQAVTVALTTGRWANDVKYPTSDPDPIGTAIEAETKRLIGIADDDFEEGAPDQYGLLDRITVGVTPANDVGNRMVYTRCDGGCGDKAGGTLMLIARDFEGGQDGLTLAELAHGALRHIGEEHDGEADWPVPAAAEMLPPVDTTVVREHPGTGQPMTPVGHPADGTWSPELSGEQGGDTKRNAAHWHREAVKAYREGNALRKLRDATLHLHRPYDHPAGYTACTECARAGDATAYPCPTVRALTEYAPETDELSGEQDGATA